MIDWSLIFLGGLLGSGHCIGMCGAFALAIGWNAASPLQNLTRQSVYSIGRCFTYAFLGATAGFGGQQLQHNLATVANVQGVLSIIAGAALVATGLVSGGLIPSSDRWLKQASSCAAATQFRSLLKSGRPGHVFLAGLATGFLPCGLVYAFLALALSSGHLHTGALIMLTFGLGTLPLMLGAGLGGSLIGIEGRKRLVKVAAFCVVLMGSVTVLRGVSGISSGDALPTACPLCHDVQSD
ncbi:MAG: sulfite exporter TauE/SafE family protein [Rhodopirellula sp.]|nr:sulfite exporter TauE/SafE family protein [Rhodopirellula sp.]